MRMEKNHSFVVTREILTVIKRLFCGAQNMHQRERFILHANYAEWPNIAKGLILQSIQINANLEQIKAQIQNN